MLTEAELREVRSLLQKAANPLFLFDDDCDGLSSYLILKWYCQKKGRGMPLKSSPILDPVLSERMLAYQPDLIVLLDKPEVTQDFLDQFSVPIVWLDHHPLVQRKRVHYYNPLAHDAKDARPTTYLAYRVAEQQLWLAAVGCIADWHIPDFLPEFQERYPGIVTKDGNPGTILFETPMGTLVKTFYFLLKGKSAEVRQNLAAVEKVEHPDELLKGTSETGAFLMRRVRPFFKEYTALLEKAKKHASKDRLLIFTYPTSRTSYTSLLATELAHCCPGKMIIVGREKDHEVRMSIRDQELNVQKILERALVNVHGYGGGHVHACGSSVASDDFERFIQNMRREVGAEA